MGEEKKEYISLNEATNYCSYSQDYLSLRARQGKLKAVKFGRNWVTRKGWLSDYLKRVEEYNNNFKSESQKIVSPPVNLPVEERLPENILVGIKEPVQPLRFGLFVLLVLVLLTGGIFFEKSSFQNTYLIFKPYLQRINQTNDITLASANKSFEESIKSYSQWLGQTMKDIPGVLVRNYFFANDFFQKEISRSSKLIVDLWKPVTKIPGEKLLPKVSQEGLVVFPAGEKDEEVKEKIKESFSDEVVVEFDETGESGIITPVFREISEQKYLFMIVPIRNNN
jgi:hypothetical protein